MHVILFSVQFLGKIMHDKCSLCHYISNLACKIKQPELEKIQSSLMTSSRAVNYIRYVT